MIHVIDVQSRATISGILGRFWFTFDLGLVNAEQWINWRYALVIFY